MDVLDDPPELKVGKRGNAEHKFASPDSNLRTTLPTIASTVLKPPARKTGRWGPRTGESGSSHT
eukprot:15990347-Heterocapsa_arctica.AAC.1